ncbi:MAG: endonuclease/exonuclease/phosphatase family protein [Pirellulales bacterium]|nr:endonuclease/exonuclease/phosphatase family protein [Pirellulales bacterium]
MARQKKQLSFATFNLFNLQLPGKVMYEGKKVYTKAEYKRKIDWTAGVLAKLQSDVLGFQELWSDECLVDAFTKAGLIKDYTLITNTKQDGISNALAVRKPNTVVRSEWITNFPAELVLKKSRGKKNEPDYEMAVNIKRFSRPLLRVAIKPSVNRVKTPNIVACVAHLKSKLPIRLDKRLPAATKNHRDAIGGALATIRRTAEAGALRVVLDKITRGTSTPAVVMGDLNDAQLSMTTSLITSQPSLHLVAKSRTGRRSDRGFYSTATLQELRSLRDVYYTHIHKGLRESLDHILVSEQFYDHSVNREWSFHEMRIVNDHLDDENPEASDHGVVMAVFDHNPAKKVAAKKKKKGASS